MSTNDRKSDRACFWHVRGKLPAWAWRELHAATRDAKDGAAVLVVEDGPRRIVIIDADDYNRLVSAPRQEGGPAA